MKLTSDMITMDKGLGLRDAWIMYVGVPENLLNDKERGCSVELRIKHDFSGEPDDARMYVYHNYGDEVILVTEDEYKEWKAMSIGIACQECVQEFDMEGEDDNAPMDKICENCKNEAAITEAETFDRTHMTFKEAKMYFGIDFEDMKRQLIERWNALQLICKFGISH